MFSRSTAFAYTTLRSSRSLRPRFSFTLPAAPFQVPQIRVQIAARHPGIFFFSSSKTSSPLIMGEVASDVAPFPLTEVDRWVLSQTDEEFKLHGWDELREIIDANRLEVFKRKPSDLRRYIKWTAETKAAYGSMTNYILQHRLPKTWGSPPFTPASPVPFEDPSDYRILVNDWPYGLAPDVTHIVVWSRTPIATDPDTGDVTDESRRLIRQFVKQQFVDSVGPDGEQRVLWFKNWVALQSVRSLEHFHVLVRNVDPETLKAWTEEKPCHRGGQDPSA